VKILVISTSDDLYRDVLNGWTHALSTLKHQLFAIDGSMPIFRAMEQIRPDLLIVSLDNVSRALRKAVGEFKPKTVILAAENPTEHQKIEGAYWTTYKPDLKIEGVINTPLGFDELEFHSGEKDEQYIANEIVICNRPINTREQWWLRQNPQIRLFSQHRQSVPNYVGAVHNRRKLYTSVNTIYLLDDSTDIGNMQASGAQVKTTIDGEFCPPHDSYTNIVKHLLEKIK